MAASKQHIAVVFDDHKLFSDSFSVLLERAGIFSAVHAMSDEHTLLSLLEAHQHTPVYLFLDYYLEE